MAEISKVIPALPVPIVANVLCRADSPLTELQIKADSNKLMLDLTACDAYVAIQKGSEDASINEGLQALIKRNLVTMNSDGLITANPEKIDMLIFYANSIAHFPPAALRVRTEINAQETTLN